jgi:hypothetical protein
MANAPKMATRLPPVVLPIHSRLLRENRSLLDLFMYDKKYFYTRGAS